MIQILGPNHHLYYDKTIDGVSTCVHRAAISDENGVTRIAFVKAFPTDSYGIPNEILGWISSKLVGAHVAKNAYILILPVDKLRSIHPDQKWPGSDNDYLLCWATEELSPVAADCLVKAGDIDAWEEAILGWDGLHLSVALSDWLYNADVNAGNLIAIGEDDFAIVDFAECLGGQLWNAKSLISLPYFASKLAHLAWGSLVPPIAQKIITQEHEKIVVAWPEIRKEVEFWWKKLKVKEKDISAAMTFLRSRLER